MPRFKKQKFAALVLALMLLNNVNALASRSLAKLIEGQQDFLVLAKIDSVSQLGVLLGIEHVFTSASNETSIEQQVVVEIFAYENRDRSGKNLYPQVGDIVIASINKNNIDDVYSPVHGIYLVDSDDYETLSPYCLDDNFDSSYAMLKCFINFDAGEKDFYVQGSMVFLNVSSGEIIKVYPSEIYECPELPPNGIEEREIYNEYVPKTSTIEVINAFFNIYWLFIILMLAGTLISLIKYYEKQRSKHGE